MNLPPPVVNFCRANGYGEIRNSRALGGGCINNASRLDTDNGSLFLKVYTSAPPDMFEREAEGLVALAAPKAIRVPAVLCFGADFILQEYIEPALRRSDFWETLGAQLAALHSVTSPQFGFDHDN
ncbi:MAG: fructosamine kinase family protein, partial [Chloroflexota bacterium]